MVGALTLVACGDTVVGSPADESSAPAPSAATSGQTPDPAGPDDGVNLVPAGYDGRFRATATVLEAPGEGPQLCLGGVEESLPPQCGGPRLEGWAWDAVEAERAAGTTWGSYTVTGTFDGDTFTLTEPATAPQPGAGGASGPDFTTPCPEPEGGWAPVEPALATQAAADLALSLAASTEGYGGAWIDQGIPDDELTEANANDPARYVLNVATTGDTDQLERRLREVWGGALCVSSAERSEAQLHQAQEEVAGEPGVLFTSTDVVSGTVEVGVPVATEERQQELDDRYGSGAVRLVGRLEPLDRGPS